MKFTTALIFLLAIHTLSFAQKKYCRFEHGNKVQYGIVEGSFIHALDKAPWVGGTKTGDTYSTTRVKWLCPSEPWIILGLGKSYKQAWKGKMAPKTVRWFLKPPSSAGNPGDDIKLPEAVDAVKVEVELVIVIGKQVKNASPKEAEAAIFGYTIGNDVVGDKASFLEKNGEAEDAAGALLGPGLKIGDGFQPFGPFIFTDFDWKNMKKSLIVRDTSGNIKDTYQESTSDLIYSPEKIVSDLSKVLTLNPGDIISTGTGKSLVAGEGGEVIISIDGMGSVTQKIVRGSSQFLIRKRQ